MAIIIYNPEKSEETRGKTEFLDIVAVSLRLAFEAGKLAGQVELEVDMENNSFFDAVLGSLYSRKTGGVFVTTTIDNEMRTRPVKYCLRSNKWRTSAMELANSSLKEAFKIVSTSEFLKGAGGGNE